MLKPTLLLLVLLHHYSAATPTRVIEAIDEITSRDDDDPYRLPTTVYPENYTITLKVDENFGPNAVFTGSVEISLRTYNDVDSITLHAYDIDIDTNNIILTCNDDSTNLFSGLTNATEYQMITISSTSTISNGSLCTLAINDYGGHLRDDMRGFYRSSYTNEDGITEWLASTHFEPYRTRRAFPCFDDPQFKATFQITMYNPPEYFAISNTPNISTTTEDGYLKTVFQESPIMPSYLNAFVVSKFAYLQSDVLDYYRVYARPAAIETANYTLYIAPPLLEALENLTGIEYISTGIGKLDQIAVPDFSSGAMENWGLITYRERNLLWDPSHSSNSYKQAIAAVIAHELSHMWFGNLVTCHWWSVTWLNEGFARYFQYHTTGEVEPTWEMDKQFLVAQHQVIFESDATNSTLALTSDASTITEISAKFNSISYNKGASVIRMMKNFLGDDEFKSGIQEYLEARAFQTALPEHLFSALEGHATNLPDGRTFTEVMTLWTEQAGYPVVNIEMSGNDAVLTQERFYLNSSFSSDSKWDIPISYTISHSPDFDTTAPSLWFPATSDSITIENILHGGTGWVVLNVQEFGYYRVNYDSTLWSALESALKSDNFDGIHVLNRAQIVDDALNLARAGQLDYATALNIVSYLENETEYYPWYSAFSALTILHRRIASNEALTTYLKEFLTAKMAAVLDTVPFDKIADYDQIYTLKKALVLSWACKFEIGDCVSKSIEAFSDYQYNDVSINANLRSVVYCNALRYAENSSAWEFLWQKYLDSDLSTEENTILTALGCTTDETLLYNYLSETISNETKIRSQDFSTVYAAVYAYNTGLPVLFQFIQDNYKVLPDYYSSWADLFTSIAERFTTQEEIDELQQFYDNNAADLSSAASTIEAAIQTATSNLEWTTTFSLQLTSWFTSSAPSGININVLLGISCLIFTFLVLL